MAKIQDFIVSRVRVKILKTFLSQPQEMFYVRQLTRELGEEINAIRRELNHLEKAGFLKSENRGNRLYYYPNKAYDYYDDLLRMFAKTSGISKEIRTHKHKLGKIKFAVLSAKFAHRVERDSNEVDLLLVGTIILPELSKIVQEEEQRSGKEINYTAMTLDEFQFRKDRRDPFLLGILAQPKIMILGNEIELQANKEVPQTV